MRIMPTKGNKKEFDFDESLLDIKPKEEPKKIIRNTFEQSIQNFIKLMKETHSVNPNSYSIKDEDKENLGKLCEDGIDMSIIPEEVNIIDLGRHYNHQCKIKNMNLAKNKSFKKFSIKISSKEDIDAYSQVNAEEMELELDNNTDSETRKYAISKLPELQTNSLKLFISPRLKGKQTCSNVIGNDIAESFNKLPPINIKNLSIFGLYDIRYISDDLENEQTEHYNLPLHIIGDKIENLNLDSSIFTKQDDKILPNLKIVNVGKVNKDFLKIIPNVVSLGTNIKEKITLGEICKINTKVKHLKLDSESWSVSKYDPKYNLDGIKDCTELESFEVHCEDSNIVKKGESQGWGEENRNDDNLHPELFNLNNLKHLDATVWCKGFKLSKVPKSLETIDIHFIDFNLIKNFKFLPEKTRNNLSISEIQKTVKHLSKVGQNLFTKCEEKGHFSPLNSKDKECRTFSTYIDIENQDEIKRLAQKDKNNEPLDDYDKLAMLHIIYETKDVDEFNKITEGIESNLINEIRMKIENRKNIY